MYFAQIKDGTVRAVIVLDGESLIPLFAEGFDEFLRLSDTLEAGSPSAGWLYDSNTKQFSMPPEPTPEETP